MATVPKSFKQQCPSCEAMVPVRDPQLIGKKIDCPKCKYRFVVEEPAGDEDEAPKKKGSDKVATKPAGKGGTAAATKRKTNPKRPCDEEDDRPAKKKGGSNMMLILGIGLAAVALVAIVVCVFAIPWGDGKKPDSQQGNNPGTNNPPPGGDQQPGGGNEAPAAPEFGNVTNLLPNNSHGVISFPMDRTLGSALKTAGTQAEGAFKVARLETQLGLSLDDVSRVITAMNPAEDWVFTVVRTKKPI